MVALLNAVRRAYVSFCHNEPASDCADTGRRSWWLDGGIILALACVGTLAFYLPRAQSGPIFNETGVIRHVKRLVRDTGAQSPIDLIGKQMKTIWYDPSQGPSDRPLEGLYRPLPMITVLLKTSAFYIFSNQPNGPVLVNALIVGLTGVLIFLTIRRLTAQRAVAIAAALLTLFAVPTITSNWVATAGEHALVPLFMCVELLCYLQFKRSGSWSWAVLLAVVAFVAPLYREYAFITPFIIAAAEVISPRRRLAFLGLLLPLLFHSVYTSFAINLVFYQHFVLRSVFVRTGVHPSDLRFEALSHFVFTLPPLISALGVLGICSVIVAWARRQPRGLALLILCAFLCVTLCAAWGTLFISTHSRPVEWAQLAAVVAISAAGLYVHRLLALWAVATWLPFLVSFNGVEVYMQYALPPFVAILLYFAFHLCRQMYQSTSVTLRTGGCAVAGLLVLACADQALNLNACYQEFGASNDSARALAHVVADYSGDRQPVIIAHTLLLDDIQYYMATCEKKSLHLWGYTFVKAVGPDSPAFYGRRDRFMRFVATSPPNWAVFLIDAELSNPTVMSGFISELPVPARMIHWNRTDVSYPFLDPLKHLIPFEYISYPGTPDLGEYANLESGLFHRRVWTSHPVFLLEPLGSGEVDSPGVQEHR